MNSEKAAQLKRYFARFDMSSKAELGIASLTPRILALICER